MKPESWVKYLGLNLDSNLSWKYHVNTVAKKISKNIGALSKLRHFTSSKVLTMLYYSLIHPFLIYGLIVWGITYKTTLPRITNLQKKALRIITFSKFDSPSSPLFKSLQIVKFSDLVSLEIALLMFDFHNKKLVPTIFSDFLTPVSNTHFYNTSLASKSTYSLPKPRTNYGKFNICFSGPKLWNSIPEEIKSKLSKFSFKKHLKSFLINSY